MASPAGDKETRYLKSVMKERPDSLLFARLADVYRKEGNIDQAIELCVNGLNSYPYYTTGRILLGRCYLEQQKTGEAIQAFTMVCSTDRRNQVAIKMLADIFAQQGMDGKAGDLYALLHSMDPGQPTLRQLCSRYVSSGTTDLFDILGLQPPGGGTVVSEVSFEDSAPVPEGTYIEPQASISDSIPDAAPSAGIADYPFTEEESVLPSEEVTDQSPETDISGSDISDRMSMLFGEQPEQGSGESPSGEPQTITPEEAKSEGVLIPEGHDVSGADISDRIEELFSDGTGGIESGTAGASIAEEYASGGDEGGFGAVVDDAAYPQDDGGAMENSAEEDITGSDISSRLGELFGEEPQSVATSEPFAAGAVADTFEAAGGEADFGDLRFSDGNGVSGVNQVFFPDSDEGPVSAEEEGSTFDFLSTDASDSPAAGVADDITPDLPDLDLSDFSESVPEVLPLDGAEEPVVNESAGVSEAVPELQLDEFMKSPEDAEAVSDVAEKAFSQDASEDIVSGDDISDRISTAFEVPEVAETGVDVTDQEPSDLLTEELSDEAVLPGTDDLDMISGLDDGETSTPISSGDQAVVESDLPEVSEPVVTGEDIADRISTTFEGETADPVVMEPDTSGSVITGEDVADRLEMVFEEKTDDAAEDFDEQEPFSDTDAAFEETMTEPKVPSLSQETTDEEMVTGSDMEERISTLFSDESSEPVVESIAKEPLAEYEIAPDAEIPAMAFPDEEPLDLELMESGAGIQAEETGNEIDTDEEMVTGSDMEERIGALFPDDNMVTEKLSDPVIQQDDKAAVQETEMPVMSFPDEEPLEQTFMESAEGLRTEDAEEVLSDDAMVTGSDMEERIATLFSEADSQPEEETATPSALEEVTGVEQYEDQAGVTGDDVSDRIAMVFQEEGSSDVTAEKMEPPVESVSDEIDEMTVTDMSIDDAELSAGMENATASMAEAADTLFTQRFGGKNAGGEDGPDEDFIEPDFEETMQFDSALFEQMLNPSEQDAPFMQDEAENRIPTLDTSDSLVKEDTSVSSDEQIGSIQELQHIDENGGAVERVFEESEGPELLLENDQTLNVDDEIGFDQAVSHQDEDIAFEVTTEQFGDGVTDLIEEAVPLENRLDKTAVFEVNISETQTDLVLDADESVSQEESELNGDVVPSINLDVPLDAAVDDHTSAVDFFEKAVASVETTDLSGSQEPVASGETPVADDTFAGVVLVDSNEPEVVEMELPPTAVDPSSDLSVTTAAGSAVVVGGEEDDDELPPISGNDVEERLSAMFQGDDLMSLSSEELLPPEDDQEEVMDRVADFYTISGEDAERDTAASVPDSISDVEFNVEKSIESAATVEIPLDVVQGSVSAGEPFSMETEAVLPEVELFEEVESEDRAFAEETVILDKRDTPFDIPDHVLTPTLADIYYQQGQLQLALEIYSRLANRDPDNEKITTRIEEIRREIADNEGGDDPHDNASRKETLPALKKNTAASKQKKKSALPGAVEDPRPLAGVRIKKRIKNARKNTRKRS